MTMSARPSRIGCTRSAIRSCGYWLSPSVLTTMSAPSSSARCTPSWKDRPRPRLRACRTKWVTPWARATSTVRSVEPSSMISTRISSIPGISRGIVERTRGSVSSSLRQGTWTTRRTVRPSRLGDGARCYRRTTERTRSRTGPTSAPSGQESALRRRNAPNHPCPTLETWCAERAWPCPCSPSRPSVAGLAATSDAAGTTPLVPATFTNYAAPAGLGESAGEPTLGLDPKTGAVLFQSVHRVPQGHRLRQGRPGKATWTKQTHLLPHADSSTRSSRPTRARAAPSARSCSPPAASSSTPTTTAPLHPSEGCGLRRGHRPPDDRHRPVRRRWPAGEEPGRRTTRTSSTTARRTSSPATARSAPTAASPSRSPASPSRRPTAASAACSATSRAPPTARSTCRRAAATAAPPSRSARTTASPGTSARSPARSSATPATTSSPPAPTATSTSAWGRRRAPAGGPVRVAQQPGQGPRPGRPPSRSARTSPLPILNSRFPVGVAGDDGRAAIGYLGSTTGGDASDADVHRPLGLLRLLHLRPRRDLDRPTRRPAPGPGRLGLHRRHHLRRRPQPARLQRHGARPRHRAASCSATPTAARERCARTAVRGAKATIGRQTAGPSLLAKYDAVPTVTPSPVPSLVTALR